MSHVRVLHVRCPCVPCPRTVCPCVYCPRTLCPCVYCPCTVCPLSVCPLSMHCVSVCLLSVYCVSTVRVSCEWAFAALGLAMSAVRVLRDVHHALTSNFTA